jgi:hypothetical protein
MSRDSTLQPSFAVLLGLAWLLVAIQLLAQFWAQTAYTFPDADDAMRLVEVRDFLGGHGWFDLHQTRVDPPNGFDSHWSRLLDAGIAGSILLFHLFVDMPLAERLTVALWPMLWLIPVMGATAAIAWRIAGREAACVVLLLAVFGMPGMGQFRPGRIDHHNAQVALAMVVIAATVWSDRARAAAAAAGAATALALAIGLESLPILALCGAAFAARYVFDPSAGPALRRYGLWLAGSTFVAFLVSVAPEHWGASYCEEIAFNSTAAVTLAGLGLGVASLRSAAASVWTRGVVLGAVSAAALGIYLWLEPRCISGPFAIMDPTVRALFLMDISEMQSLGRMLRLEPLSAVATASFPLLGLLATALVARELRRDFGFLTAAAAFLLAAGAMVAVSKFYNYALWLGVPLVAAAAHQIFVRLRLRSVVAQFAASLLVTPMAVTLGAITIASAAGTSEGLDINPPERQACTRADNYAPLARLPQGLMAMNVLELGPYLVAFTPQSVLAAPYHIRLGDAILASNAVFARPPEEARRVAAQAGVDYVVICGTQGPVGLTDEQTAASLWGRLKAGDVPDWLDPVPGPDGYPLTVFRVRPGAGAQ